MATLSLPACCSEYPSPARWHGICVYKAFNAYQQWTLPFSGHFPCNLTYRTVSWLRSDALLRWQLFLLANHGTVLMSFIRSQLMYPPFDDRELLIWPDSSQWLNANPAYLFNRMNYEAFIKASMHASTQELSHQLRLWFWNRPIRGLSLPFATKYGTLVTTMLALSLSPFRLPGNNTMLLTMKLDCYLQRVDIAAVNPD